MRILLVDDSWEVLNVLTHLLQGPEIEIHAADTCAMAEARAAVNVYDWAVVDFDLHGSDGMDVLRRIRRYSRRTRLLVFSADADDSALRTEALVAGAEAVFTKPLQVAELCEYIREG